MSDDDQQHDDEGDVVAEADAMADALEHELADEVQGPSKRLSPLLAVPAAAMLAAIAAPLHPDGYSFAQILYVAWLRGPLDALVTLLGFGSPFCFAAIVLVLALAGSRLPSTLALRLLVSNLSFLHAQLALVAGVLWSRGLGVMPLAMFAFALVSGGYFVFTHARDSASEDPSTGTPGLSTRWLIRWGATMIVAVCGWMRVQMLIGVQFGWAVELILGAGVMMTVLLMRRPSTS
jgi:hypothetical protein